jgi:RecJ-like exonuclease
MFKDTAEIREEITDLSFSEEMDCPKCEGEGSLGDEECEKCEGAGMVPDEETVERMKYLQEALDEIELYVGGETALIQEEDLAQEAQSLAEDVDGIDIGRWPYYLIDWEKAGEEIAQDYSCTEIDGTTYYYR